MRKIHISLLALGLLVSSACGQAQDSTAPPPTVTIVAQGNPTEVAEPPATQPSAPTEAALTVDPCALLERAEIQSVGFTQYDIGEPQAGTGVPLGLGQAVTCQWEVGDPNAQFHHRLYLYIFQLGPDETAESAYQGQLSRMQNTVPVTGIGEQAAYSETSQTMLAREGEVLIYLRADVDDLTGEVDFQSGLERLAQLILERV